MKNANKHQKAKKHQITLQKQFVRKCQRTHHHHDGEYQGVPITYEITAPDNFRLLENTQSVSDFFRRIRAREKESQRNKIEIKAILTNINSIDFPAVVVFMAVVRELKRKGINLTGNFPDNSECRQFLIDANFLHDMYDSYGHKYLLRSQANTLEIKRGNGKLTRHQLQMLNKFLKTSTQYLSGKTIPQRALNAGVKEICGNSIEWSNAFYDFWMIGQKFEEGKITFVAVDLGKGILATLRNKPIAIMKDIITSNPVTVIENAFNKKYGSNTQEINRNHGLPSIKKLYDDGLIDNLQVITNNVIFHFGDTTKCRNFALKRSAFNGTLYTWEFTQDNINTNNTINGTTFK